jgi:hypothetical protein
VSGNRLAPFGHGIVVATAIGGKVDIGGRPAVVLPVIMFFAEQVQDAA